MLSAKNREYQNGMTLIEVIISLVIIAILVGVIYQIFITGSIIFDKSQMEYDLIQNASVAVDWITRDVRNADYISINGNTLTITTSSNSSITYSISDGPNGSNVLMRTSSDGTNAITSEEAYIEDYAFTPLPPSGGGVEVYIKFQAYNVHAKKKQKSLSGNFPSFSIREKVFVRKVILNSKWGG